MGLINCSNIRVRGHTAGMEIITNVCRTYLQILKKCDHLAYTDVQEMLYRARYLKERKGVCGCGQNSYGS